jgi:hypothetical protein
MSAIVILCITLLLALYIVVVQLRRNYRAWACLTIFFTSFIIAGPIKDLMDNGMNATITNCFIHTTIDACRVSIVGLWMCQSFILTLIYPDCGFRWDFATWCLDQHTPTRTKCLDDQQESYIYIRHTTSYGIGMVLWSILYYAVLLMNTICKSLLCCRCFNLLTLLKFIGTCHTTAWLCFYNRDWIDRTALNYFWVWEALIYLYPVYGRRDRLWDIGGSYINLIVFIVSWTYAGDNKDNDIIAYCYYYLTFIWPIHYIVLFRSKYTRLGNQLVVNLSPTSRRGNLYTNTDHNNQQEELIQLDSPSVFTVDVDNVEAEETSTTNVIKSDEEDAI